MRDMEGYIYKYETHCHCNWCSACGRSTPQEMAKAYYDAGYTGIVLTDHFLSGNSAVDRSLPWEEKMRQYYAAYEAARAWAEENQRNGGREFHVLFGIEHVYTSGKEVLTYGIDLDFLLDNMNLHMRPIEDYARLVHDYGGFLSHAHPFRHAGYIDPSIKPEHRWMDGAEIFNFYTAGEDNKAAAEFAEKYDLHPTSGGDEHSLEGASIGKAGVVLRQPVDTSRELAELFRADDYRLLINGELV